ncbi:MAG: flagellar biosynthesis protein FlhF [Lachnospiraceae bacterium]|jgi:flagellar biosynthesis protein FlhF|nr:flagellar biosynthesis protein FlhF [Lachnospiraceae bacterium]
MTIKKFVGKTEEEASNKARMELGSACVIMNVRTLKPSGMFKAFKSPQYEVTAAIEEKDYRQNAEPMKASNNQINLAANEDIQTLLKQAQAQPQSNGQPEKSGQPVPPVQPRPQPASAFRADNSAVQLHDIMSQQVQGSSAAASRSRMGGSSYEGFEERLSNLQNMLEQRLSPRREETESSLEETRAIRQQQDENMKIVKMIYKNLIDNEVDEKYANLLVDEVDSSLKGSLSIDHMLSNVYQKMILKFGQANPIDLNGKKPKVIFFIGPTGVGKTTTIAKVASKLKVDAGKKLALLTADTYRIAAEEQLRTYANILDAPLKILYSPEDLEEAVDTFKDMDVILVDTAGFSHKNQEQRGDTKKLIEGMPDGYDKEVYLVLSATTKYRDLIDIADAYREITDYKLIFTKLDETSAYGNIYNMRMYTDVAISYVTNGQNVPDDIEVFDTQSIVKKLLGGN